MQGSDFEYRIHDCPEVLYSTFKDIFVELKAQDLSHLKIVQCWQRTSNDMASYSAQSEDEREQKTEKFLEWGRAVCEGIQKLGYWVDMVDPLAGIPVIGCQGGSVFVETEVGIHLLGYTLLDVGCCKVLLHPQWRSKAFPSSLLTLAPHEAIQSTIQQLKLS
uniref:Methylmalonic aciduria and homocystinuria type D protein n=1 Tax=Arcella intermedia TaxID=1963864 RepID=A0A6B2LNH7_9EUKA